VERCIDRRTGEIARLPTESISNLPVTAVSVRRERNATPLPEVGTASVLPIGFLRGRDRVSRLDPHVIPSSGVRGLVPVASRRSGAILSHCG
jgi:hypothetical protein